MSEHEDQAGKGTVRFNEREVDALRDIVTDWVNEQLVLPPFPHEVRSIIEKLDIAERIEAPDEVRSPRNFQEI